MSKAILEGFIPFYASHPTGWHISPKTFPVKSGSAPVCFDHWLNDTYTYRYLAKWEVTDKGIKMIHWIDPTREKELAIMGWARSGKLFLSFGTGAAPAATRASVARSDYHNAPTMAAAKKIVSNSPLLLPVEHWAYTLNPASKPQPAVIVVKDY